MYLTVHRMKRLLPLILASLMLTAPVFARLGETEAQLRKRYGSPVQQTRKDVWVWLFEDEDEGQLMLTVTLDADGHSVAEGLKPLKRAKLDRESVERFITAQLEPYRGSKTTRTIKGGGKYHFAGHDFTCAADEVAIVDEPNSLLIIWNNSAVPAVMAVRPIVLQ